MGDRGAEARRLLEKLGVDAKATLQGVFDGAGWRAGGGVRDVFSPVDGSRIARVREADPADLEATLHGLHEAFRGWRMVPAPRRGEVIRLWGDRLRKDKEVLGRLVSLEMGKSLQEGLGEVQEMIDICEFAVGLSRQLYGKTMHSERPSHRMMEQWHPLGICGIISAFNFPTAVYSWNAAIALVCGDPVVWKPSEKTPLTAIAVQRGLNDVLKEAGHEGIAGLVVGGGDIGAALVADPRVPIVSATGSCAMGYKVGAAVAARMGRAILELGGNNAVLVTKSAELKLAVRAVLFGAVGTAGQRCTSTRRVLLHKDVKEEFTKALLKAYKQVTIGDPLDEANVMGPLIDEGAVAMYEAAVKEAKEQGGKILFGGRRRQDLGACYVEPTIVEVPAGKPFALAKEETFAPILYLFTFDDVEEAILEQNDVRQGLSSAMFTRDVKEMERFLSHAGSDCGIANINLGTSGAEIGGAFGGEKETGGGREAGSDAWQQYMRRQTCTINWGDALPLAQGIRFEV